MRAKINGIEMEYATSGREGAPALVLHHPLATSLQYWDPVEPQLAKAFRVIRFDARGHGKSEAPAKTPYDFKTLAADTIGLMDHLGVKRAAFVGLSMGGMVGQELGVAHASRFTSLTLVSTTSRVAPEMRHLWRDRVVAARENGMGSQVEPCLQRWVAAATRTGRPDLVATFTKMIEATPLDGYAGWCTAIETLDNSARLGGIKLPVQVIVGDLDPATPVAASEAIHRGIPGSSLVIMPGVSHMLSSEAPDAFVGHVLPFAQKHAASGAA